MKTFIGMAIELLEKAGEEEKAQQLKDKEAK